MIYPILFLVLLAVILGYFRIANHYNIIDKPNERSSHTEVTIRGGGVIFAFAILIAVILHPEHWLPGLGLLMISVISFIDDRITLSSKLRIIVHIAAMTLMFIYMQIFLLPFYVCIALYIISIGIINMYNFMDGINGITGVYTLVVLAGLQYQNLNTHTFVEADLIWLPMLASIVFLFFNFRKKAKCFAGDVGSITIAFWIVFLLLKLIFITSNWTYILFLAVYGIDSVLTIIHRVALKQNIFKAHRLHFYQLLANEYKISHLVTATGYGLIQLLIIAFVIMNRYFSGPLVFAIVLLPLILVYVPIKQRLLKSSQ
jgi:UDP-N-acetylmuramyl pentapeptide phosphotransferase/UDP-N-acetylglucosamine-1-phosphate transferase